MEIKTSELHSLGNVRSKIELDSDFVQSIKQMGILTPLSVYRLGEQWVVKDGHRRLAAAVAVGLTSVPCAEVDVPSDPAVARAQQVIINNMRQNLDYLSVARGYQELIDAGWTRVAVAAWFNISETSLSLALSTLKAHPKVQEAIVAGRISSSAVEPLLPLPWEDQERLIDAAIAEKTVRKVAALVRADQRRETAVENRGGATEGFENAGHVLEFKDTEDDSDQADPYDDTMLGVLKEMELSAVAVGYGWDPSTDSARSEAVERIERIIAAMNDALEAIKEK